MKLNKRGDKLLSLYWFVILAVVAGGIFGMVYIYYGSPYDVREIEAHILINQIADCVSYGARISSNFVLDSKPMQISEENFLKKCNLNFGKSEWQEGQYSARVEIYKLEDMNFPLLNISVGNKNWLPYCEIQEDKKRENFPQCVEGSFYSLDNLNNQYIIKILGVVRKTEKNVKM